jgi:5-methyltetrahydrofolate--homocysteine methyltransferase
MLEGRALLDGAMGTALIARGLPAGGLPEEWLLSAPGEIAAVHAAHAAAGARVLLTCTFSAAAPRLEARVDAGDIEALCARAVALARGAGTGALVAGALGPTGLAPPLGPGASPGELVERYARPLAALAAGGADVLWIESQHDLAEARAALAAARRTGLPTAVTFGWPERGGRYATPDGAPAAEWLRAAALDGAAAVGVNCVFPGPVLDALVAETVAAVRVPVVVKPSPGLPGQVLAPAAFAAALRPAIAAGARLVGGCCGAGAEHLRAVRSVLFGPEPGA